MKKGDRIKEYTLLQDMTTVGGGMCRWAFVKKGEEEFFIKEYLRPKYPVAGSPGSEAGKKQRKEECTRFEAHQKALISKIRSKTASGGNLVFPVDFFRDGPSYYKVTEKVDVVSLKVSDLYTLSEKEKYLLMKTAIHSVKILHDLDIVHGDLKPDNILIKHSPSGTFVTKVIDFDNSYFSGRPANFSGDLGDLADFVGDQVYFSPEMVDYLNDPTPEIGARLRPSSDIFALGILFHQYYTGEIPGFDRDRYTYTVEAVMDRAPIQLDPAIPDNLSALLAVMLDVDPNKRPSAGEVFKRLQETEREPPIIPSYKPASPGKKTEGRVPAHSGTLVGKALKQLDEIEKRLRKKCRHTREHSWERR
jgi:serine/threonine protein kinase